MALLLVFPYPLGFVPFTWPLAEAVMAPIDIGVRLTAEYVLGIEAPVRQFTGSGDTLWHYVHLLFCAIASVIATGVWSAIAKRRAHPELQAAMLVVLRYYVASVMLGYGMAKVFVGQFPPNSLARLDGTIGEMSPMGMLWTFMGASGPYTVFAGLAEVIGSVLLLWRRTTLLGALVIAAVMTNVVMLNFSYDVPVKLYSMQLLAMAIVIALPSLRRLIAAMLGHAVGAEPLRVRGSRNFERVRFAAKAGFLAIYIAGAVMHYAWMRVSWPNEPRALAGIWTVETYAIDGTERAPLTTDDARWRKMIVSEWGVSIRYMTDRRVRLASAQIDPETKSIIVPDGVRKVTWRYELVDDRLRIWGEFEGKSFSATLKLEPAPLLVTRGFHWIQESPYNR
jgi:hypothetical protein